MGPHSVKERRIPSVKCQDLKGGEHGIQEAVVIGARNLAVELECATESLRGQEDLRFVWGNVWEGNSVAHTCMPKIVKMYVNSSTSDMMYLPQANEYTPPRVS